MIQSEILKPMHGKQDDNFDLNITENELVYDMGPYSTYSVQVTPNTAWATAVITLSRSNDGKTPYTLEEGITVLGPGAGMTSTLDCIGFARLMLRLTTNEGGAASCKVSVCGKAST